jgi:hypothetical protein
MAMVDQGSFRVLKRDRAELGCGKVLRWNIMMAQRRHDHEICVKRDDVTMKAGREHDRQEPQFNVQSVGNGNACIIT